jgi:hypothetical protein
VDVAHAREHAERGLRFTQQSGCSSLAVRGAQSVVDQLCHVLYDTMVIAVCLPGYFCRGFLVVAGVLGFVWVRFRQVGFR